AAWSAPRGRRLGLAATAPAALERSAATVSGAGADVLTVRTDVGAAAQVQALAEAAVARFGAVHLVCNNAGIAVFGHLVDATPADWEYTMRVNFWGVVHGVQTFAPRLVAQGQGGHIVNTASMAGLVGMEWLGVYCAAKVAGGGVSGSLHRQRQPHGIGLSVLCLMIVQTDSNRNSVRNRPAALRNPGDPPDLPEPEGEVAAAMQGGVIGVDEVARRVVRAIERNDLYVLTHPEQRGFLR